MNTIIAKAVRRAKTDPSAIAFMITSDPGKAEFTI
jgi:hypothetical protein